MSQKPDPVLNETDPHSALWQRIRKHLECRLALMRAKNDTNLDERKTAHLRGRLAEIKALLALDKPAPATNADDDLFD